MAIKRTVLCSLILLFGTSSVCLAQTNPSPQQLPYTQNFSGLPTGSSTLPAGWQGWRIGTGTSTTYQVAPATADLALISASTASNSTGGIHNYNGKVGLLHASSVNATLALSISTSGRTDIQVGYDIMTIRNAYNGGSNTRIGESTLQYRIGTSGDFTTLTGIEYQNNTTQQTASVTTPQNSQPRSITLPPSCNDRSVLQLRWVARDVTGSGDRPSFAVDNIVVDGTCFSASISYPGSPFCSNAGSASPVLVGTGGGTYSGSGITINPGSGVITLSSSTSGTVHYQLPNGPACPTVDATATVTINAAATADAGGPYLSINGVATNITATTNGLGTWSGGTGVFGDPSAASTTYTPDPSELGTNVALSWTTNDPDGAGPCAAAIASTTLFVKDPTAGGIFLGGSGRGDAADLFVKAPTVSSVYTGGNGRGDVADLFVRAPIASSIFLGGSGRGDVADLFVSAPIASNIFSGGNGRGDVADLFVSAPIASSIFTGGNGRGDVSDLFQTTPLLSSIFFGGNGRGDVADLFVSPPIASSIFSGGNGRGDVASLYIVPLNLQLSVKAFLEGPFDPGQNSMNDDLRSLGLIPSTEPYSSLGYSFVGGGGETVQGSVFNSGGGGNRIVDWVVVELRAAGDPSTIVASRCALIQRDGDVVGLDGSSALEMSAEPGTYFVSILHRNHLGVMTANDVALSPTPVSVDFTQSSYPVYGTDARKAVGTSMVLWAGDVNFDGVLKYTGQDNDRDPILQVIGGTIATNTVAGYRSEDVNMDGTTKYTGALNDRDPILQNIGGTVATNTRLEQMP